MRAEFPELLTIEVDRTKDRLVSGRPGTVGSGGNSGFQMLDFVAQTGASNIILTGFDMQMKNGVHWHGPHGRGLGNPNEANMRRWRAVMDGAAAELAARGIDVVNVSRWTALTAYRQMTLPAALRHFGIAPC
ncbi:MAG: hypothetical protein U0942_15885 [Parvibaculum sp.]|uniref:hypothetical protein n=1 Tax=Parvibaculum sp. TaxID=2024848 RepID=UPI002ABA01FE|nr:hypothetical protein [Parvibaculum sp.]MDZ4382812.1 hypothetical protein [Parvibaculum sp.]